MKSIYFLFFFSAFVSLSQNISQDAVYSRIKPIGEVITDTDSLLGSQTFVLKYHDSLWCYLPPLRELKQSEPKTRKGHGGLHGMIKQFCPNTFRSSGLLDSLENLANGERVILFGYNDPSIIRKPEYLAIRLEHPINLDSTLELYFEFYAFRGIGNLLVKTNDYPTNKGAVEIDKIKIDSSAHYRTSTYSKSFGHLSKSTNHDWLILELDVIKSTKLGRRYDRCWLYMLLREKAQNSTTIDY